MAVIRVNKTKDYTVMSNRHFREKDMSLKAKGLLSLMLSLPNEWDYTIEGLATLNSDGRDSIRSALNELEQLGYMKRCRERNEKGMFGGAVYTIYEEPQEHVIDAPTLENPMLENPMSENPMLENPTQEKLTQLNTNKLNTKKLNTKKLNTKNKSGAFSTLVTDYALRNFKPPESEEVADLLNEWLNVRKAKRAAMTERAIQMNLDKLDKLAHESSMSVKEYLKEVICRGWAAFYVINNFSKSTKQLKPANNKQLDTYMQANAAMNKKEEDASLYAGLL